MFIKEAFTTLQRYMCDGPIVDYLIIAMAMALGASYAADDGCPTSIFLAKTFITFTILSLWLLMIFSFMKRPLDIAKAVMASVITFIAQINIVMALTMDMKELAINLHIVLITIGLSILVGAVMAEVQRKWIRPHDPHGQQRPR